MGISALFRRPGVPPVARAEKARNTPAQKAVAPAGLDHIKIIFINETHRNSAITAINQHISTKHSIRNLTKIIIGRDNSLTIEFSRDLKPDVASILNDAGLQGVTQITSSAKDFAQQLGSLKKHFVAEEKVTPSKVTPSTDPTRRYEDSFQATPKKAPVSLG